jgi:c-di-GMP-binding flagellar brake protein YcgR
LDRYWRLELLLRRHIFIEVKFPRLERSFQSLILELHAEPGYLLIDELYPPEGRQLLLEGDIAEISSRAPDIAVTFSSRLLQRETAEQAPMYRMELPDDIGVDLRRHAFRVYVEREPGLALDLGIDDADPLDARIVNLSADGIKLAITGDATALLEQRPLLEGCVIRLPSGADIDCAIELRNAYPMRTPSLYTLLGGRLTVAQAAQRGKLDQFLAAVQRKQRRREMRMG